jgi:gliding motility-associated-like protein
VNKSQAQLGFCNGNSGDPIFVETFGTGTINTPLPNGTTTFRFVNDSPFDGEYTVASNSGYFDWHNIEDHTSNDNNGKMLIVNADFDPGEFYRTTITGLCEQTTYEFSAWLINLLPASGCGGNGISINIQYEIWDSTDKVQLAIGATGSIENTEIPIWNQFALLFKTEVGQTSVILKIKNHGVGGCGNDLAIDDIVFKSCGDSVTIEDNSSNKRLTVCEDETPFSTQITAIPDFAVFSSHFYQWQESFDGITWTNITGENNNTYNTAPLISTTFYRVLISDNVLNLNNSLCNSSSDIFEIRVIPIPNAPLSNGNLILCENDPTPLSVKVPQGVNVNWYDTVNGGNLLLSNSITLNTNGMSGTYYAEAVSNVIDCQSSARTPVSVNFIEIPQVNDETLKLCENTSIVLQANSNIPNATYFWNNGENTEQITVTSPGIYNVKVSNNGCTATKAFTLERIDNPILNNVYSNGKNIVVSTLNEGNFQYSLDGNTFQFSNFFTNIDGGLYTIYAKEIDCDEIVTSEFLHFHIPKYFTPNNDGFNDMFELKGIEFFNNSQVSIFNRYGKLLKSSKNAPFSWDGTLTGEPLPSDDYWYVIVIDDQKFTGHFTLKR